MAGPQDFPRLNIWGMLKNLLNSNIAFFSLSGVPVNGTSGSYAGKAGPSSLLFDYLNGSLYINIGTKASPTWIGIGGTADGSFRSAIVDITSAQLLAIRATPITLVAAPGAGKLLSLISGEIIANNGTAYVVGTNDLAVRYNNTTGDIISQTIDTAGLFDQTTDIVTHFEPLATDSKGPKADVENTPLVLHNTGAAEFTTGTGTARVLTLYSILTTGW
jgi:hypothetical protein